MWACYPPPPSGDPDWWWAQAICRSNRFYESCFFKRPLIAIAQSGDGAEVAKHGIGLVLDQYNEDAVLKQLADKLHGTNLTGWLNNITRLPRHVYQYTDEGERLSTAIRSTLFEKRL